jgi:hypothetical protein
MKDGGSGNASYTPTRKITTSTYGPQANVSGYMPSTTSESPQSMTTERTHEGCQRQGKSADSPVTKVTEMTVEVPEADDAETAITATEVAAAAAAAAAAVAVEQVAAAPQTEHKNGKGQTQSAETFEFYLPSKHNSSHHTRA